MYNLTNNLPFIISLSLFMLANVVSGVIKARKSNNFVFKNLLSGLFNYLLWLLAFSAGVLAINNFSDITLTIGQDTLAINKVLELSKTAIISLYAYKFIENILEYHHLKVTQIAKSIEVKEDKEVG